MFQPGVWDTVRGGVRPVAPPDLKPPGPDLFAERLTTAHNRLLMWLSAAGAGSWETFARVGCLLGAADPDEARRLLRRLVLLGHVETGDAGRQWCAAPPVLAERLDGSGDLFWCGLRTTPQVLQLPVDWTWDDEGFQPGNAGPPCRRVRGAAGSPLPVGSPFLLAGRVAERIADALPGLDGWRNSLPTVGGLVIPERVQRWTPAGEVAEPAFRVVNADTCAGPPGLYRLTFERGRHSELHGHLGTDGRFRRGDWYGLRFLALAHVRTPPAYSRRHDGRWWLSVPAAERWPMLYERALVLASGLLPRSDRDGRLWYRDVPPELARRLCELLGVRLTEHP